MVVASAAWHKVVDNTFKAFVSKNEVLPSCEVEFCCVHVDVKSAGVVYFGVAEVEHPANLFEFLNSLLSVEDWAYEFECVVS